jgi:hypothetical protein
MKHAGSAALDELEDLISKIRARSEFREPRRGVFYLKGRACLHFHEDASGTTRCADQRRRPLCWWAEVKA